MMWMWVAAALGGAPVIEDLVSPSEPLHQHLVVGTTVRLRESPSPNAADLGPAPPGRELIELPSGRPDVEGWLHIRLLDGREGWIESAATRALDPERRADVLSAWATEQLLRTSSPFAERMDLVLLLDRTLPTLVDPTEATWLGWLRLKALEASLVTPAEPSERGLWLAWVRALGPKVMELQARVEVADAMWLTWLESARSTPLAEEAAWAAAHGMPVCRELGSACHLQKLRATFARYLELHPSGLHAGPALRMVERSLAQTNPASQTILNPDLAAIRGAVAGATHPLRDQVLRLIDGMAPTVGEARILSGSFRGLRAQPSLDVASDQELAAWEVMIVEEVREEEGKTWLRVRTVDRAGWVLLMDTRPFNPEDPSWDLARRFWPARGFHSAPTSSTGSARTYIEQMGKTLPQITDPEAALQTELARLLWLAALLRSQRAAPGTPTAAALEASWPGEVYWKHGHWWVDDDALDGLVRRSSGLQIADRISSEVMLERARRLQVLSWDPPSRARWLAGVIGGYLRAFPAGEGVTDALELLAAELQHPTMVAWAQGAAPEELSSLITLRTALADVPDLDVHLLLAQLDRWMARAP